MRNLQVVLVVAALAFGVFSVFFGLKDSEIRGRWRMDETTAQEDRRHHEQDQIQSIVKPVSLAYFLFCLGFFIRAWKVSPRRWVAVVGAVGSLVMVLWSVLLDGGGISFDEVYPAWILAAVVLPILQSLTLRPAAPTPATAQ
jgi:hypothetical protein